MLAVKLEDVPRESESRDSDSEDGRDNDLIEVEDELGI
jgi:hypothetical protein